MIDVTTLPAAGLPDDLAAVGVPVHSTTDGPVTGRRPRRRSPAVAARRRSTPRGASGTGSPARSAQVLCCVRPAAAAVATAAADVVLVGVGAEPPRWPATPGSSRSGGRRPPSCGPPGRVAPPLLVLPEVGRRAADDVAAAAGRGGVRWPPTASTTSAPATRPPAWRRPGPGRRRRDADAVAAGAARGARVAASVALARDLVNEPPELAHPAAVRRRGRRAVRRRRRR